MNKVSFDIVNKDLTQKREDALLKIKNSHLFDEFIKKYEINDQEIINNASKFLKVFEENETCKNCLDLSSCKMINKGVHYFLGFDSNGEIALKMEPCKKNNVVILNKYFIYLDYDKDIVNYDINSLVNPDYIYSRKKLILAFKDLLTTSTNKGIYLYGSRQAGKTFMLAVFSKVYAERKNKKVAFIDASRHFKMLSDIYFKNIDSFNDLLTEIKEVDLLVIDDFGNEHKNEIIRDMIVFPLLNERMKNNKLTCFTSPYSLSDLVSMYSLKEIRSPKANQLKEIIEIMADTIKLESLPYRE